MTTTIRFRCPHCRARIKAAAQLSGRNRGCPQCRQRFVVPSPVLEDVGPLLVPLEEEDRFVLGITYRVGAA